MIPLDNLSAIVALIAGLSVASERLVEIIKGFSPCLGKEITDNPKAEARRKAWLQILALVCGLITAGLAAPILSEGKDGILPDSPLTWIALGLLASGGSGAWNSVQSYLTQVKQLKKAEATVMKTTAAQAAAHQPIKA